jgi:dipeptidyl aminopeptidase/acylaminoacyl peptidase
MRRLLAIAGLALWACSTETAAAPTASPTPAPSTAAATPAPTPALPANYLESLRAYPRSGGQITVGDLMWRGAGFAKHHVSWPSGGQTMTGTISLPDGGGPFPVVVVNHGHIPSDRYWIGQDSGIFGDPMAAHGFISIAPNYPGYTGSGPGAPGLTTNQQIAVIDMDLVSSLASLPQADPSRLAVVGHSQGGGVSQILLVVDPRFKAVVLHAPVSSDEAENARRVHDRNGTWPAAGDPAQNADYYAHASPRNYFAAGEAPVLLVQGTLDHTIPAAHTQGTYDALTAKGVEAQLNWIQGGDHDLVGANLDAAVAAQEAWIRKALGL